VSEVITIGLDIAKYVFHVHGADERGRAILSKRISRGKLLDFFAARPSCTVALEACGGAHHWARQLTQLGHEVRLIPPAYVKAVCEAAKERRDRCRGDLRSGAAPKHAVRGGEERTAAGGGFGVSDP
jgi:transposase